MAISGNANIQVQFCTEDTLKVLLFKECVYQRDEYLRLKKTLGEFDSLVNETYVRFQCCFNLIVRAGLEDDFYLWQQKEGAGR